MIAKNCFEAVQQVDMAMSASLKQHQNYYVLGGIVTSALIHPETKYSRTWQVIKPKIDAAEPIRRDNGTMRDIDILVGDVLSDEQSQEIIENVRQVTPLVVSVFGLDKFQEQKSSTDLLKARLFDWTSKRTIDDNGVIRYELFPLAQAVQPESFDPWTLELPNNQEISVLHPAAHMLAYRMRSISGVRYKDRQKLSKMTDAVMATPQFKKEVTDGYLKEWLDFSDAIYRLREGTLDENDPMLDKNATQNDIRAFSLKSRLLGAFESNERIIKIAQSEFGERALSPFTRTK